MPDETFPCGVCDRTDLTLTKNGKVRSHTADGKRRTDENPNCPGGSDWPAHDCAAMSTLETSGEHMECWRVCSVCGAEVEPEDPRPTQQEFHDALRVGSAGMDVPYEVEQAAENVMDRASEHGVRPAQKEASSVTPSDADSFLGGDDTPDEDRSPSYFPARYDGTCDTSGHDFSEGDMIRRAPDGGWEAEACCGGEIDEEAEQRPRATAPQLPVRAGRYRGPHPETGKASAWTRTTTFAEAIADNYALNEWQLRMVVLGLIKRPDLFARVQSLVQAHSGVALYELAKLERQVLNGITEDARLAAGSKERARKGTILHKHTQEIDMGRKGLGDVPEEFRPDVNAYLMAMTGQGFECVPDLIERSTTLPGYEVAGTFDRILRSTREHDPVTLESGRTVQIHEGDYVLGDVKSGTDLSYAWLEILIQLAIYAHGVDENGVAVPDTVGGKTTWRWARLPEFGIDKIRLDVGIVMHMPYSEGRCQLKYADLITGWRGAQICRNAIEYRKIKPVDEAVAEYVVVKKPKEFSAAGDQAKPSAAPPAAPVAKPRRTWEDVARTVRTKEEANKVWSQMNAKRQELGMTRINAVVALMRKTLQEQGVV